MFGKNKLLLLVVLYVSFWRVKNSMPMSGSVTPRFTPGLFVFMGYTMLCIQRREMPNRHIATLPQRCMQVSTYLAQDQRGFTLRVHNYEGEDLSLRFANGRKSRKISLFGVTLYGM